MSETRKALRAKILAARNCLSPEERRQRSQAITERLLALPEFAAAKSVFIYVSFRSEVETLPLIGHCLRLGKRVSVPLTLPAERRLLAYALTDPGRDLAPGYCGIPEPQPGLPLVDPASLEVVVAPGSVFDPRGGRLGYGGGFYDRFFLDDAPRALRIGLAFDLQLVAAVPLESHDQTLDYLVSESRLIHSGRKG